ncbi:MAG TPA: O-antigen ligase family protein [Terracidiphilus sp.]|nr:O-antigen ligase family protein [Terracidiphilus sp.]
MQGKLEHLDFILLCLFVLSQAYAVPLFTVGPSWATWPTAGDLVIAAIVPIVLARRFMGAGQIRNKANKRILVLLVALLAACTCSYVILCRAMPILYLTETGRAAEFGEYQLYRIVQAIVTFAFASQIDLTIPRRKILALTTVAALLVVCAALFLEYLSIVPASAYAGHLPKSLSVAGPWAYYASANGAFGYGTIGFNHAYSSSQVLLLLVLYLFLEPKARNFTRAALVFIAEAAILISGCRAVFAGSLLFLAALFIRRPRVLAAFAWIFLAVAALTTGLAPSAPDVMRPALDRVSAINPFDEEDPGERDQLWLGQIQYLNEKPLRWLTGGGFGTAVEETGNAHMMYLQILNETGIVGLAAFAFAFAEIFRQLRRAGPESRPMIFGTLAILVASIAQETLYPVPAMGQFIAFYALCLALALRPTRNSAARGILILDVSPNQTAPQLVAIYPSRADRRPVGAV